MVAFAFGIAFGIGHLAGTSAEGPLLIIAGPLCLAMDLIYRWRRSGRRWLHPSSGGALAFIPVGIFGLIGLVLGVADAIPGRS